MQRAKFNVFGRRQRFESLQQVAQRNGISLSDLPRAMAAQGIDYRQYREDMRNEMILDALRNGRTARRAVPARPAVSSDPAGPLPAGRPGADPDLENVPSWVL